MSNKPKYLEMTIPVASHSVQWCDRVCCRWGQKKYTHDIEGKLKGKLNFQIFRRHNSSLGKSKSTLLQNFILPYFSGIYYIHSILCGNTTLQFQFIELRSSIYTRLSRNDKPK
jgi:hypothetical protein